MLKKLFALIFTIILLSASSAFAQSAEKSVGGISFTVPEGWVETQPQTSMRAFQFEVPGTSEGEKGEMAVFYFGAGMGGGVDANIARWKGQFTKLDSEETAEKEVGALKVTVVSLKGTFQPSGGPMMAAQGPPVENSAVLGAIAEGAQGSVFFKLTGSSAVLEKARPDFEALIDSLK